MLEWVIYIALYILSVTGTIPVPPWALLFLYLMSKFFGGGSERVKDQEGFEKFGEGCPSYGYCMVQGRREYMEDYTFQSVELGPDGKHMRSFFGVFDGHSGKKAAIHAKERLFSSLSERLDMGVPPEKALREAFISTDAEFLTKAHKEGLGDGSTVTTCLIIGRDVWVANAGDSRTILTRGVEAKALSDDHKPDRPSERRRIMDAGGQVIFIGCARVNGILATSRGFGDKDLKPLVSAEPEITHHSLGEGDDYILLASDGLWDVMQNVEAARILAGCADAEQGAQALTRTSLRMGTMDNVSALVVDLRSMLPRGKGGAGGKQGTKKEVWSTKNEALESDQREDGNKSEVSLDDLISTPIKEALKVE